MTKDSILKHILYAMHSSFGFILTLVVAGVIGGMTLAHALPYGFIFVVLVPAYQLIYKEDVSYRRAFVMGWLFGFALIGSSIYWVFNSFPLDWAGVNDPVSGRIITTIVWAIISIALSFFIGLWVITARRIKCYLWVDMITMSILWVIFENIRMWGFTGITWGPGSIFTPYFSFGMLGYSLARSDALLQIARWGGVYTLSTFVAFVSFTLFILVSNERRIVRWRALGLATSLSLIFLILHLFPYVPPVASLTVATLSTNFPAEVYVSRTRLTQVVTTIKSNLSTIAQETLVPDVIVLPEDLRFLETLRSEGLDPVVYLQSLFGTTHEVLLIDSARITTPVGTYARVTFLSSLHGVIAMRDKRVIIPFGEYVPYLMEWGMKMAGMNAELTIDKENRNYLPGPVPKGVIYHGSTLVVLLCSEMIVPTLYHDTAKGTINPLFINMSSQSDFHNNMNPFLELKDMVTVQSAWSNAPFFQSTNGARDVRILSPQPTSSWYW